jgi:hypothetical protein
MPTRAKASPVKLTGLSPEGEKFESHLEEDYFVLLRFDPAVIRWSRCQHTIEWSDGSKIRRYTPDAYVEMRDANSRTGVATLIVEVKPDFREDDPRPKAKLPRSESDEENRRKWEAAAAFAHIKGWKFVVKRESDIRTVYLENARFLLRHKERPVGQPLLENRLLEALRAAGTLTLRDWVHAVQRGGQEVAAVWPACYSLIAADRVSVDLHRERLSMATLCASK